MTITEADIRVWDDVLPDPVAYRRDALAREYRSVSFGAQVFHGIAEADETLAAWLTAHVSGLVPTLTFFRQSPAWQVEPNYVHDDRDMGDWTALLYLGDHLPLDFVDGTRFWEHRQTSARASTTTEVAARQMEVAAWRDPSQWTVWHTAPARFNRLVLFPSRLFHSRVRIENYGTLGVDARLIQVLFASLWSNRKGS